MLNWPRAPPQSTQLSSASELLLSRQPPARRCSAVIPPSPLPLPPPARSVSPYVHPPPSPSTAVNPVARSCSVRRELLCWCAERGGQSGREEEGLITIGEVGWVMYGSPVPKDLNLPAAHPQSAAGEREPMSSPGLLRYRSAPSNLLGEVMCGDHDFPVAAAAGAAGRRPDHAAADTVLARFLAGHHPEIRDTKPPRPAVAAQSHFLEDAASMASQQQQFMYQSQQQQQMAAMEGLYRTLGSGGTEPAVAAGNSLVRQSSSPAGFLNHLNMDNGYGNMLRAGMAGGGFRNGGVGDARLKGQLSFSSRQGSVMSQISEMGSEELDGGGGSSSPEEAGSNGARGYGGIPGYPMSGSSGAWDEPSPTSSGVKRPRDSDPASQNGPPLAPQLSLPGGANGGKPASAEMAAIEKFLQFQDAVPCKIRAKRGCATHPRSIAERVRRTKISERIRKLQELVPNMEKQTNTADMLDLAVDYVKGLQKQVKVLNDSRASCTCSAGKLQNQFTN